MPFPRSGATARGVRRARPARAAQPGRAGADRVAAARAGAGAGAGARRGAGLRRELRGEDAGARDRGGREARGEQPHAPPAAAVLRGGSGADVEGAVGVGRAARVGAGRRPGPWCRCRSGVDVEQDAGMVRLPVSLSGTVGTSGRVSSPDDVVVRTADLRLAGAPLPVLAVARVYTCGITPYDVTHLGHAATFVWADVLTRVLAAAGADVHSARNVTDVDDVLTRAAEARGRHYDEFALGQEYVFAQDMAALGVHRPTVEPRARHHVAHVQQLAAALLATDTAYVRDGAVYFRGAAAAARSGLPRERALELTAEFGDDPGDRAREDPFDVPVWRPSGEADPAWPSPWGWGRPGWHAECAAMATAVLGPGIDVLVGGEDLAFPHHAIRPRW